MTSSPRPPLRARFAGFGTLCLLCLFCAPPIAAQAGTVVPTAAPLLWRIEGFGTSYVYGTLHVADPRVLALPPAVREAIERCDFVYTETPMDEKSQRAGAQRLRLPRGETLRSYLPPDLLARLDAHLRRRGSSLERLQHLKPWVVTLRATMLEDGDTSSERAPLDQAIRELALGLRKQVDSLESVEDQLLIFERLTLAEQVEWLRATFERIEADAARGVDPAEELIQLYLQGDGEAIHRHLLNSFPGEGALRQKLIDDLLLERDLLMSKRISDKLRSNPSRGHFFAVGAGHLAGPRGILAQLRARGYLLTRVGAGPAAAEPAPTSPHRLERLVEQLRAEVRLLTRRVEELEQKLAERRDGR